MNNSETLCCILIKFCANVVKINVHLCLSLVRNIPEGSEIMLLK